MGKHLTTALGVWDLGFHMPTVCSNRHFSVDSRLNGKMNLNS